MTSLIDFVERLNIPVELLASITILLAAALASVAGLRTVHQRQERHTWREGGKYVVIEVPPEVDPKSAVLAWRHLLAVEHGRWRRTWFGQPHLIWEYAFTGSRLSIRVWAPGNVATNLVIHAVDAAWPGAACTVIDAEPPLPVESKQSVEGGVFTLAPHGAAGLPLVADTGAGETLRGLVSAGVSHRPSDTAVVQIVACPASRRKVRRAAKIAAGPKQSASLIGEVLDLFTPGSGSQRSGHRPTAEPAFLAAHRKAVAERLATGTLWMIQVRYAVATDGPGPMAVAAARDLAAGVAAVLGGAWRRRRSRSVAAAVNTWSGGAGVLVSADELAQVAHLPSDAIMPALARAGARTVAPVADVLGGGRAMKTLGVGPDGHRVALSAADACYHTHLLGSTGSGKSTLLLNLILADIRDRRSVVLIDPKGDLVRDVLDRLDPSQAAGRLVLIDPAQANGSPGLPPIAPGADPEVAIDHLVGICRRIWERHWGPRADDILRQSLRTQVYLHAQAQKTGPDSAVQQQDMSGLAGLSALPTLLTDKAARAPYTAKMNDPVLNGFWTWFDSLPVGVQSQAVGPVLARLRTVLGRAFVRETIGEPAEPDCVDLPAALDRGGIILARLPKGTLGEDTAKLVGSVLVARVWQAVLARQDQPETSRRDAHLYIDEAQNFLNLPDSVEDMLAESRALRLGMTLAHQHLAQLDRDLQAALSANCRTKIYFTCSPEDARVLARHTEPNLTDYDLSHLGAYTAAVRPVAEGLELPTFTMRTLPAPDSVGQTSTVIAQSTRFPAFRLGGRR